MAESSTDAAPDRVAQIQADWRRERPDVDTSPQGVIGRLHRVGMSLTRRLTEVYARFDLTEPEFDLLATLRRSPGHARAAGDLAANTMVTTGGLTKRVDRLEERGLVRRRGEASDARRRTVELTDAGRELIDRAFTAHMRNERDLVDELSPSDAADLERILTTWLRRLGEP
ncbi:MAG: MarR family transcriptional regulator [Microbacterium sp.]|nr:MarR family transcriptional regulator [Microbacterium sp.]